MNKETILEVRGLKKSFGGIRALRGVDLSIKEKEIVGLIGPNGCGKSTTFNIMTGIIPADSGSVKIFGEDAFNVKPHVISQLGVSRTFQHTRLFRDLTVIENLMLPPKNQQGARVHNILVPFFNFKDQEEELKEKAWEILELLEIPHMANNYTSELSGGQSKLVDIGRVLMSDPKILLLDEPVAGVAGPLAEKLFHKIIELRDNLGISIMMIEHNMEFILRKGVDNVYVMSIGSVIAEGDPDKIRGMEEVIEAYLGE